MELSEAEPEEAEPSSAEEGQRAQRRKRIEGDVFLEGNWRDESTEPHELELYRFKLFNFGRRINFVLHTSVTKWVDPDGRPRDEGQSSRNWEEENAFHDIPEVLSSLYSREESVRYFVALYIPGRCDTDRTFYAASTLIRYNSRGRPIETSHGYVEIGCSGYDENTWSYFLWHLRFRPVSEGLPFKKGFDGLAGLKSPGESFESDKAYIEYFYTQLRIPGEEDDLQEAHQRGGRRGPDVLQPGEASPGRPFQSSG